MPKIPGTRLLAEIERQNGSEPIFVLACWWRGVSYYATKTTQQGSIYCYGNLASVGDVTISKRADNSGTTGSCAIRFDDVSGSMKTIIDWVNPEKGHAALYLTYEGLGREDWLPLLSGRIAGPITWSEGDRYVDMTLESEVEVREFGFAPTPLDFNDLLPDAYNVPWPAVFGSCSHVPCVKVRGQTTGLLINDVLISGGEMDITGAAADWTCMADGQSMQFSVVGGSKFPQGVEVKVIIDTSVDHKAGIVFKGKFTGDLFKITEVNTPKYVDLEIEATGDENDDQSFYLKNHHAVIMGHHCMIKINDIETYNYCIKQEGNHVWFKYPFWSVKRDKKYSKIPINSTITAVYAAYLGVTVAGIVRHLFNIYENYKNAGKSTFDRRMAVTKQADAIRNAQEKALILSSGAEVRLWNQDDPEIYVASLVQLSSITAVYAYKRIKIGEKDDRVLAQIPQGYYEKQLISSRTVDGNAVSGLLFYTPLREYYGEGWEDTVYISGTSTVGPNVADILEYVLSYSDLAINNASFIHAGTMTKDANFAVFDRRNALDIAREIAWQAKCALVIDSDVVSLRYLDERPVTTYTFTDNNIEMKSMETGFTGTRDIITRIVAEWAETYKYVMRLTRHKQSRVKEIVDIVHSMTNSNVHKEISELIYLYENNVNQYGVKAEERKVYIFNDEDSVINTVQFWGWRMSNCWRKVRFKTFLHGVILQPFDGITMSTSFLDCATGVVESVSLSPADKSTTLDIWLPSLAGTQFENPYVWED